MKIRSEQLDYLLRQEQLGKQAATSPKESFGRFFDQEIGRAQPENVEAMPFSGARTGTIDPMLLTSLNSNGESSTADTADSEDMMQFMSQADGMLNTLDTYAKTLGNAGATPRNAWELLGTMDSQVAAMRGSMSRMSPNAVRELESVVNELEVLASTEKFKFNRGDYL